MLDYHETPLIEIKADVLEKRRLKLLVKREDLNHPFVSGNKWWKLRYNLEDFQKSGCRGLLTFGGAFSNHILATAAAAKEIGCESVGIIRGERPSTDNSTLQFAEHCGMQLHFIPRTEYRQKTSPEFIQHLNERWPEFFVLPEGGTNDAAIKGCAEFADTKLSSIESDFVCVPIGTGGTMAGMVTGLKDSRNVLGFPALKDHATNYAELRQLISATGYQRWSLLTDYHFGGYAKSSAVLDEFISKMKSEHDLPLEPVYSGKMFFGIFDLAAQGFFPEGSTILALHTGGLRT